MTKTYSVKVTREITQTHHLEIEAEDEDEARDLAEDEILNIAEDDWDDDERTSDPEIDKVTLFKDDEEDEEVE
jgi:hypothetical protein